MACVFFISSNIFSLLKAQGCNRTPSSRRARRRTAAGLPWDHHGYPYDFPRTVGLGGTRLLRTRFTRRIVSMKKGLPDASTSAS